VFDGPAGPDGICLSGDGRLGAAPLGAHGVSQPGAQPAKPEQTGPGIGQPHCGIMQPPLPMPHGFGQQPSQNMLPQQNGVKALYGRQQICISQQWWWQ